ncbi:MAG: hypothetical protein E5W04_16420 [Mesorhizobium sp.]|nr:MAG: hypothetical protein E5W04_16420 [Mesorhizobium sp.]
MLRTALSTGLPYPDLLPVPGARSGDVKEIASHGDVLVAHVEFASDLGQRLRPHKLEEGGAAQFMHHQLPASSAFGSARKSVVDEQLL